MTCAYLGLGSNLDRPRQQIRNALRALADSAGITVVANAGFYLSRPMGPQDQPDYINTVVVIETQLSTQALLLQCQQIETSQGRQRKRH
jgi:2-amino-4-hydroxy-6-hydroxymethyldihydropteridine diphosphokinase